MNLVRLAEVFEPRYGVNLALNSLSLANDGIPFVSRTAGNNGVSAHVAVMNGVQPNSAHTLSVAVGGSVLATFYQAQPYYSGRDVYYLIPKNELSAKEMLLYAKLINSNAYKYNYGRQANRTLSGLLIPDKKSIQRLCTAVKVPSVPSSQAKSQEQVNLSDRVWKGFEYHRLFCIKKGKRLTKSDMTVGDTPFIGAVDLNNGHRECVGEAANHEGNTITVNYNGSVGEAFYQPRPYWASDDVNVLYPRFLLNPYIGLFIITVIKVDQYRFNYGRKWKLDRMKESIITLPIDSQGNPDWKFMEQYIKSLPYSSNL